jgi:TPR repeat protein
MACTTLAREREPPGASAPDAAEAAKLRPRAVRLLQEACEANGWECRALAAAYEQGDGVPRDPEKAGLLWKRYADEVQRACEHDAHPGLYGELAHLYAEGKGVARDARRAQELRERAAAATRDLCEGGLDADSCFALGRMYEKGEGVEASAPQAIAFYGRAGQAKHDAACGAEKRLREAAASR